MNQDSLHYDIVIVGGGVAGLSASIRLKQLNPEYSVSILEKGAAIGSHILSGAIFEPRALHELIPDWQLKQSPLTVPVTHHQLWWLSAAKAWQLPNWLLPASLHNRGNYVLSLGELCRWLAIQAEQLGVEIFTGFAAAEMLYQDGRVIGVTTGPMGIAQDGSHKPTYTPGVKLYAKYTILAEGCRGFLSEQIMIQYNLRQGQDVQTYGLGIKEIWEVDAPGYQPGMVQHYIGWPLANDLYGGGFSYHLQNNKVAVGLVLGLDYKNPYLDPFAEMQRLKTHPKLKQLLQGGKRIEYGARALNEGGLQAIPKLTFPGGVLIGCAAGFLNVPKLKGSHTAMKSGMLAAKAIHEALIAQRQHDELPEYSQAFIKSWAYRELYTVRNFRHYFNHGLRWGMVLAGIDLKLCRGTVPWTLHHHHPDRAKMLPASQAKPIEYPNPDHQLSFDRNSSIFLSNILHHHNQPCHLVIRNDERMLSHSFATYGGPEQFYCPAGVYEYQQLGNQQPQLKINSQNCIHCKACDIKDPQHMINWTLPEGGSGPQYQEM